jgi:hypothetical protein
MVLGLLHLLLAAAATGAPGENRSCAPHYCVALASGSLTAPIAAGQAVALLWF